MTPGFVFAEQVRSIVRSGKKEMKIGEGARITSAAADLIKEHRIRIIAVAPNEPTGERIEPPNRNRSAPGNENKASKPLRQSSNVPASNVTTVDITEEDFEDIVNRVLERFQQLKEESRTEVTRDPANGDKTASSDTNADDLIICRCEEITRGEIKLAIRNGLKTLNGIKRVTRAGMGLCQGQTCQRLVAQILTQELGLGPTEINPTTARGPVRPLRLSVFANN